MGRKLVNSSSEEEEDSDDIVVSSNEEDEEEDGDFVVPDSSSSASDSDNGESSEEEEDGSSEEEEEESRGAFPPESKFASPIAKIITSAQRKSVPGGLFCSLCNTTKHVDSFSAKQKKITSDEARFCLAHTGASGYNAKAVMKVKSNLGDSDDELQPALVNEVWDDKREQQEFIKLRKSGFAAGAGNAKISFTPTKSRPQVLAPEEDELVIVSEDSEDESAVAATRKQRVVASDDDDEEEVAKSRKKKRLVVDSSEEESDGEALLGFDFRKRPSNVKD
ncbi:hypothetical protein BASA81_002290 [Batrachochytrium salamandrivorans]|nr:hypothetical protein BASA81_002290 [Batrachochytrium salamandrivorans]